MNLGDGNLGVGDERLLVLLGVKERLQANLAACQRAEQWNLWWCYRFLGEVTGSVLVGLVPYKKGERSWLLEQDWLQSMVHPASTLQAWDALWQTGVLSASSVNKLGVYALLLLPNESAFWQSFCAHHPAAAGHSLRAALVRLEASGGSNQACCAICKAPAKHAEQVANQAPAKASKAKASKVKVKGAAGADTSASTSTGKDKSEDDLKVADEGEDKPSKAAKASKKRSATASTPHEGRKVKRTSHEASAALLKFWADEAPDKLLEHNAALAAADADKATNTSSIIPDGSGEGAHDENPDKGKASTGKEASKDKKGKDKKDTGVPMAPHCKEFPDVIMQLGIEPTYSAKALPAWDHVLKWFESPAGQSVFQQHMVHGLAACDTSFLQAVHIKKPHLWIEALKSKDKLRGAWVAYNIKPLTVCADRAHLATTNVKGFSVDMALISDRFSGVTNQKKVGCLLCSLRDQPPMPMPTPVPTAAATAVRSGGGEGGDSSGCGGSGSPVPSTSGQ